MKRGIFISLLLVVLFSINGFGQTTLNCSSPITCTYIEISSDLGAADGYYDCPENSANLPIHQYRKVQIPSVTSQILVITDIQLDISEEFLVNQRIVDPTTKIETFELTANTGDLFSLEWDKQNHTLTIGQLPVKNGSVQTKYKVNE